MKYIKYILIIITLVALLSPIVQLKAATSPASTNTNYHLLAPLPGVGDTSNNVNTTGGLGPYLNAMIKIFIGLCAVLSVVMIIIGGLEYMTSELISSKEEGKKRILSALGGLILALGAYALLFTINPDLLKSDVSIPSTTVTTPEPEGTCTTDTGVYTGETEAQCGELQGQWVKNP